MHQVEERLTAQGRASVERGNSVLARMVAMLMGFPAASSDTSVAVRFEAAAGVETWTRTFGQAHSGQAEFRSRQWAGTGRSAHLVCESFGPLTFGMALLAGDGRLSLVLRRWSILGVPLPLRLGPRSQAFETCANGKFRFHVEIDHPLTGLIVRYIGWLVPTK